MMDKKEYVSHVQNRTLGGALRLIFGDTVRHGAVRDYAVEAADRLLALYEVFEKDQAQAMREVERLDVYRARRMLALLLMLTTNILDEHEAEERNRDALLSEVAAGDLRLKHVGGSECGMCAACGEPLPCNVLLLLEAVRL